METRISEYKNMIESTGFHAPIGKKLGMKFTQIKEGTAVFELDVRKEHLNSVGVVQGGVITAMLDASMGLAFGSVIPKQYKFATMEINVSFLKPIMEGHLIARGSVLKKGKRAGFTEGSLYLKDIGPKTLVAKASGSLIVIQ